MLMRDKDLMTIVDGCVKGSPKAQKALYDRFSGKMMTVCLRYLKNTEEAEDVFQTAFVKVFRNIKDYHKAGSLEGWIRRVFVNSCLDQIRRLKKTKFDQPLEDVEYKLESEVSVLSDLAHQDLLALIAKMPDGYRVVFNLFAIEGFSHKEIGEHLGISENTSKSQYKRARGYLLNCIETLGHETR